MLIPIEISKQIKDLVNRSNVQIHALDALAPTVRNRFIFGKQPVLVMLGQHAAKAKLHDLGDGRVSVESPDFPPYLKPGGRVVVVLPAGDTRYVLQANIEKLFPGVLELTISDPRSDERFRADGVVPVEFLEVPPGILMKLMNGSLVLVRDTNFALDEPAGKKTESKSDQPAGKRDAGKVKMVVSKSGDSPKEQEPAPEQSKQEVGFRIHDAAIDRAVKRVSPAFEQLMAAPHHSGQIFDVSRGGVCIKAKDAGQDNISNQLIHVRFRLGGDGSGVSMDVSTLGIRRGLKETGEEFLLHIMFIKSFPTRAAECMKRLLSADTG